MTKESACQGHGFLAQFPSSFYQHWDHSQPTNFPTEATDTQIYYIIPKTGTAGMDRTSPFSLVNSVEVRTQ